tara:strand:- start:1177 stop:2436 length:1260 start_codon:yes stop_codon:yes gene_type:complete
MEKFVIKGPNRVSGVVDISGSKNAALPILAATLLFDQTVEIKNLPRVKDIETMINLLKSLGSNISFSKDRRRVKIKNSKFIKTFASYSLVKKMRAGILVLGPLVSKYGSAIVSMPGGCQIGVRPINYHLSALRKLKMSFKIKKGYVHASANKLKASLIKFPKISVGATENLIMASVLAEGKTTLKNCAIEPEIKDLINFLKSSGAQIKWIGKRTLEIFGVKSLNSTSYSVMGDRIEAGTFCVASVLTNGNLKICGFNPQLITTEINLLKKMGARIKTSTNKILINGPKKIKNLNYLVTKEYPGFPTDLQAQFMVLLCKAKGKSIIQENIFENRYLHCAELRRLGANILIKNRQAIIYGDTNFEGAEVMSSDLRASVALVLAAIVSKGKSTIHRIYHLIRGYENLEKKLKKIGVKIKKTS